MFCAAGSSGILIHVDGLPEIGAQLRSLWAASTASSKTWDGDRGRQLVAV
jgi:hypothetical protein